MITKEQLGHRFGFVTLSPGEISISDNDDDTIHDFHILQFCGDPDGIFILVEKANYTFKKSKTGDDYILTRVVLIKTYKDKQSGLYLPGAEVHEWEGD